MTVALQTLLDRSIKNMGSGIHSVVKESALEMIKRAYAEGIYVQISDGYRSMTEQATLYGYGRSYYVYGGKNYANTSKSKVTNAKPGQSYHNFGLAIDYFLVSEDGNTASWTVNAKWKRVASIGKELGFKWGGDWTSFKDYPHLEMTGGLSYSQLLAGRKPALKSKVGATSSANKPAKETITESAKPSETDVKPTNEKVIGNVVIAVDALNIRKSADLDSSVVGTVLKGSKFPVYESKNGLYRISKDMWISAGDKYVNYTKVKVESKPVAKPVSKLKLTYKRTLKKGSTGEDVKALQKALNELNFKVGKVDGDYGKDTEDAVERFQKVNLPYEVDGIAGENTINKINSLLK